MSWVLPHPPCPTRATLRMAGGVVHLHRGILLLREARAKRPDEPAGTPRRTQTWEADHSRPAAGTPQATGDFNIYVGPEIGDSQTNYVSCSARRARRSRRNAVARSPCFESIPTLLFVLICRSYTIVWRTSAASAHSPVFAESPAKPPYSAAVERRALPRGAHLAQRATPHAATPSALQPPDFIPEVRDESSGHSMDVDLDGPGAAHDAGAGLLLRRAGALEERAQHHDDELHLARLRGRAVGGRRLLAGLHRRQQLDR